jgi:hypothetical protein
MSAKRVTAYQRGKSSEVPETSDHLVSRFVQSLARRGVPELGARAVLNQFRKLTAQVRAGRLNGARALLKGLQAIDAAERKASELQRARIRQLARGVKTGRVSIVDAIASARGAA